MEADGDMFFEASWEVCNKVGGIYTVVKSKIELMVSYYGKQNYVLIGPYFPDKKEFVESVCSPDMKRIFDELATEGIHCHFGHWLTKGEPQTILIDYNDFTNQNDDIKTDLYEGFGIDSLGSDFFDFDTPLIWSRAVGKLLEKIKAVHPKEKIVAQFHEWMAGGAALYLRKNKIDIGTVFTTHATMLGRAMASANVDLYAVFDKIDPEEEARKRGVLSKWQMEKACAEHSSVFTTVSEITGLEAEKLLGIKPDVLLLNGLDMNKFPTFEEVSVKHKAMKSKVQDFCMHYFFPYQTFDLDNTLFFFICGRYEYHDKGMDIMTEALGQLNEHMKKEHPNKTVVTFFWVPANQRTIRTEVLENQTYFRNLKGLLEDHSQEVNTRIMSSLINDRRLTRKNIFKEDFLHDIKKKLNLLKREGTPPLCTHEMYDEENDPILNGLKKNGLMNKPEDRVKAVFYPVYLTGDDRLLNTDYKDSMMACHLGIFPSYYEPWGYTPLEAAAVGIAAITTDLAGFGRYIQERYPDDDPNRGIFVIKRKDRLYEDAREDLLKVFKRYLHLDVHDRIRNKIRANKLAFTADWKFLAENYIKAHNLAVERR